MRTGGSPISGNLLISSKDGKTIFSIEAMDNLEISPFLERP
jgi:hypothetical protein